MNRNTFEAKLHSLRQIHQQLLSRPNRPVDSLGEPVTRYENPVLTAAHTPLEWRYDLSPQRNPFLLERMAINAVFNAGAIGIDGVFYLAARVEGADRKSFIAIAESKNGLSDFRFHDYPVVIDDIDLSETNLYDMRLVRHEDGWIYGLFCVESKDPDAAPGDLSAAIAQGGIARTRDLRNWQRLGNLKTASPQQRNHVLHPEFVNGQYAFYTRPQDDFIDAGSGGGIGWGLSESIEQAEIKEEKIIDSRAYHTIKESKNGLGPAPLKTDRGWLHVAHGVRQTAAGLRYVLYLFMTALDDPSRVTHAPGGYFMAPQGDERVGDVSNVLFSNGWVADEDATVYLYYASSDTRLHVATAPLDVLVDYVINTPPDGQRSSVCVRQRLNLIDANRAINP